MLETLQARGRNLWAEGASGHLPLPHGVAAVIEFDPAGGLGGGSVRIMRRFSRAICAGLGPDLDLSLLMPPF